MRISDWSSDVCSSDLPKLGIIWEPVAILRLGASWGRSFKMPTLYQQYGGYYSALARAARYGTGYPASATVLIASGPDSRLGPERSENLTLSAPLRSEEQRLGKEICSKFRSRWSTYHQKKNHTKYIK